MHVLQVTISNNSNMAATSANYVLTAVHFSSPLNLTPVMANVSSISSLLNCSTCTNASVDIGAEWAYQSAVSGVSLSGPVNLLSASDFGIMSLTDRFGANNVAGTVGVGGFDFGIVGSAGASAALTGSPLIGQKAVFYFNTPSGFSTSSIGNVGFLYGSGNYGWVNFDSGYYGFVDGTAPEPGSWLLMAMGVGALGWMRRKRQA